MKRVHEHTGMVSNPEPVSPNSITISTTLIPLNRIFFTHTLICVILVWHTRQTSRGENQESLRSKLGIRFNCFNVLHSLIIKMGI